MNTTTIKCNDLNSLESLYENMCTNRYINSLHEDMEQKHPEDDPVGFLSKVEEVNISTVEVGQEMTGMTNSVKYKAIITDRPSPAALIGTVPGDEHEVHISLLGEDLSRVKVTIYNKSENNSLIEDFVSTLAFLDFSETELNIIKKETETTSGI